MPLSVITLSVRGWGPNPEASKKKALKRLRKVADDMSNGVFDTYPGVIVRSEDPGNGGPCGPVAVRTGNFEFLYAIEDLPEWYNRNDPAQDEQEE